MKLYYTKGACSLAVRIVINELGLTSEYEAVDLKAKHTETGLDYFSINPKGSVPALEIDGKLLTENAVILQFLADNSHASQLLPPVGDFNRYHVLEWLNYIAAELHKSFSPLFNPVIDQKIKDEFFIPLIKAKLSFIDKHLLTKCLVANDFTLPDAYFFVMLTWALNFKFNLQEWPRIYVYFNQLKQRKSIQKSLQEEGLIEANSIV